MSMFLPIVSKCYFNRVLTIACVFFAKSVSHNSVFSRLSHEPFIPGETCFVMLPSLPDNLIALHTHSLHVWTSLLYTSYNIESLVIWIGILRLHAAPFLLKRSYWPRGKVLGGSSNLNYMVYIRGSRHDYDEWAANGGDGWSYDDVLPYFLKSEDIQIDDLAMPSKYVTLLRPLCDIATSRNYVTLLRPVSMWPCYVPLLCDLFLRPVSMQPGYVP